MNGVVAYLLDGKDAHTMNVRISLRRSFLPVSLSYTTPVNYSGIWKMLLAELN